MQQPHPEARPILVIGATGRHAGTGTIVVDHLLSRGRPVRALVRTEDDRAGIISTETGRPVRYEHISAATWRRELEFTGESDPSSPINSAMAQHIPAHGAALSKRAEPLFAPDPHALTTMLNRPPTPFAHFVRQNLPRFAAL
jgi:hypothetical protein